MTRVSDLPEVSAGVLCERYEALFLDAYGVLVHQNGPLPGARGFIEQLNAAGKPYRILSNDASRLTTTTAERYRSFGLDISAEHILNSGLLLADHFRAAGLGGSRCLVLGTEQSAQYVADAGGQVVDLARDVDAAWVEAVVVCDDAGFDFLPTVDRVITLLVRRLAAGQPVALILPNPDLIYQSGPDSFGLTAGSIALVIEAALARIFGSGAPRFTRLGKPHRPIFDKALALCGTRNAVMIGDQLQTDIAGAAGAGIDSALICTGLTPASYVLGAVDPRPTYRLGSLALGKLSH